MMHREFHESVALANWWAHEARRRGLDERVFVHVGNETGGMGARRGYQNKCMGVRAGMMDFCLFVPSQGYHALMIELKAPVKTARLSTSQIEMKSVLENQGYVVRVCFGWDEAREAVEGYLGKFIPKKIYATEDEK